MKEGSTVYGSLTTMYLHKNGQVQCIYWVHVGYCKTLLLLLRWDTGEVRDRSGGMVWLGLRVREQLLLLEMYLLKLTADVITFKYFFIYFLNIITK